MRFLSRFKGFTLIELVMSITIIGIAVIGTLVAIQTANRFSGDPLLIQQSISIAEAYLEEIVSKQFTTGACPGGTRPNFTAICQYNGLNQAPTDQLGNPYSTLSAYNVTVTVDSTTASLGSPSLTPGTQVVRIDVTVTHPLMPSMTFSVYRTNYS